jgi:zinc protease
VAVTFATRAGSVDDLPGKEGLASLDLEAIQRGTKTKKALQIDEILGDLGAAAEARGDREYSSLRLEVLDRNLPSALGVLADVVRNPSFPADEVEREKKKRLDLLAQAENNPNLVARRVSAMLAFGRDHAYGHPPQGFPSTVANISSEDLSRFHNTQWKPGSSALIFVGDISLAKATELARHDFGSWTEGAAPPVNISAPQPMGPGKVFLINRPEAAQTVVAEVLPGPARGAPDYYPLSLADAVWGGAVGARLGMNLREDKGYSYGVFSFPQPFSKYGMWIASGGIQTNKTKESLVEFQKELKFIAGEKPVSNKELTSSRNNRVRGYAQEFESMERVSGEIVQLWSVGLPMSELQREPDQLERASLEAVNAAAEKYATPGRATLLLIGDLSKIEPGVRELNLGQVVILDSEGRPAAEAVP